MLVIHDEQLAQQLRDLSQNEQRPIEDILKWMLAQYPKPTQPPIDDKLEAVKQARRKAYAKARSYWESIGDFEKARLSDEALDEQFQ